jgi:acyl-CoA thioester hydrolase
MASEPVDPLDLFPVVISLPIQWGDQDAFAHVNNTVYSRWFESARIAYCLRVGLDGPNPSRAIGPILASITCHFRRPLRFPDSVRIGARIARIGRTSLTMDHLVVGEASGDVAAEGTSVVVVFDYGTHRPHPLPPTIYAAIEHLEGKTFEPRPPGSGSDAARLGTIPEILRPGER